MRQKFCETQIEKGEITNENRRDNCLKRRMKVSGENTQRLDLQNWKNGRKCWRKTLSDILTHFSSMPDKICKHLYLQAFLFLTVENHLFFWS